MGWPIAGILALVCAILAVDAVAPHAPLVLQLALPVLAVLGTLGLCYRGARRAGNSVLVAWWWTSVTLGVMVLVAGLIVVIGISTISFGD